MIHILIECEQSLEPPIDNVVKEILCDILKNHDINSSEITIVFGQDELLNKLKKLYFYKDEFTDVIAFRLNKYSNVFLNLLLSCNFCKNSFSI